MTVSHRLSTVALLCVAGLALAACADPPSGVGAGAGSATASATEASAAETPSPPTSTAAPSQSSSATSTPPAESTDASPTATPAPSHSGTPTYLGPVTATVTNTETGVTTAPPAGAQPKLSWQEAYGACGTGQAVCNAGTPTISLASVTIASAGSAGPNGTVIPLSKGVLAYVMRWTGYTCSRVGPPNGKQRGPEPCSLLSIVDADTGDPIYAVEGSAA